MSFQIARRLPKACLQSAKGSISSGIGQRGLTFRGFSPRLLTPPDSSAWSHTFHVPPRLAGCRCAALGRNSRTRIGRRPLRQHNGPAVNNADPSNTSTYPPGATDDQTPQRKHVHFWTSPFSLGIGLSRDHMAKSTGCHRHPPLGLSKPVSAPTAALIP